MENIKIVMKKVKKIDTKQPKEGGIVITGLYIRNGRINPETGFVEDP